MNLHTKLLIFIFSLAMVLYGAHSFALRANLYWTTSWADSVTHSLGGVIIAAIVMYVASLKKNSLDITLCKVIGVTLVVGIMWEIFELGAHLTFFADKGYIIDTVGDLFFDMFGGYIGYLFLTETLHD